MDDNLKSLPDKKQLYDEKEFLDVTLHSIGDGIITTNINGCITLMNETAEELTGWNRVDALGRHLDEGSVAKLL